MKTALFLALAAAPLIYADTALDIENASPFEFFGWEESFIWDNGVPTPGCTATMPLIFDEFSGEPVEVTISVSSPATIGALEIDFGTEISVDGTTFEVTGTTKDTGGSSDIGFIRVSNGRATLGTLEGYDAASKSFDSGSGFLVSSLGSPDLSILEFRGADIEVLDGAGFNLHGPNAVVRDQNTGIDALRNLRVIERGFISLRYGHVFQTVGNLRNESFIGIGARITPTTPPAFRVPAELNVAGNLINNDEIRIHGNSVLNVSGSLSGTGMIEVASGSPQISVVGSYSQTNGTTTLGNEPPAPPSGPDCSVGRCDGSWLRAVIQTYTGSTITGNGTLIGNTTITAGNFRPGNSPGRVNFTGDLTLDGTTTEIEIGGTTPGTAHDWVFQADGDNGLTLGGDLEVTLLESFKYEIVGSDTFEIFTSDMPLTGSFTNIASGSRLETGDGLGSFQVDYAGTNTVTLSNFLPNITPEPFADWVTRFDLSAGDDGPLDDPNGDGITNLEAYFRGIAPVGSTKVLPVALSGNTATIVSPKSVTGVILGSEVSRDLTTWDEGAEPAITGGTSFTNTYEFAVPSEDRQFFRFVYSDGAAVTM